MKSPFATIALTVFCISRVVVNSAESSSSAGALSSERKIYKIRPGDRVSIIVFGREKLGVRDTTVDAAGEIRIAGVSEPIPAAGLSVDDIQAIAESRYKKLGVEDARASVFGYIVEGNRVKLVASSVPPVRLPDDPIRSDAKQK